MALHLVENDKLPAVIAVEAFVAAGKTAMEKAVTAGQKLIDQKDSTPHGEWMPWCEANLPIKDSMVNNLMQLARNVELLKANSQSVGNFNSINEALTEIRRLSKPKPKGKGDKPEPKKKKPTSKQAVVIDIIKRAGTEGIAYEDMKAEALKDSDLVKKTDDVERLLGKPLFNQTVIKQGDKLVHQDFAEVVQVDPSILSMSAAKKLETAINQHKKALDQAHARDVAEAAKAHLAKYGIPQAVKAAETVIAMMTNRSALITKKEWQPIKMCCHPDGNVSDEKKSIALNALNKIECVVMDEAMEAKKKEAEALAKKVSWL